MSVDLESYPDEVIYMAFWLQHEIYTRGLEGHRFMGRARDDLADGEAKEILEDNIQRELNKL